MARSPRTVDAYRADWSDFSRWCDEHGRSPLPATDDLLVAYIDAIAPTLRASTVKRRLAAIRAAHLDAGYGAVTDSPAVTAAMARTRWHRRDAATVTAPITADDLRAMSRALPDSLAGVRDRAILLVGYGAALRPGEIVGLTVGDVSTRRVGLRIETPRGRITVPFGSAVELCAVTAWTMWTARAALTRGPAFRPVDRLGRIEDRSLGAKAVGRIVRRAARNAGLDADAYTGLSLRRGMVTTAAGKGASRQLIMRQTGHRSDRLVREYIAAS